jgi:MSHA pilin protein MshC
MRKPSGFTIVELVAVMVIIGIVAAVSVPRFIGRDAFDARGSYATLMSALRYAQKSAIAQHTNVYANLNTTTRVVCLGYTTDCSSAVTDPATQAAYSKTLSNNVNLTASVAILGFDALGRPIPNATATYTVQNAVVTTDTARTITVEAETGYVR